jgi:hypothetical protein
MERGKYDWLHARPGSSNALGLLNQGYYKVHCYQPQVILRLVTAMGRAVVILWNELINVIYGVAALQAAPSGV